MHAKPLRFAAIAPVLIVSLALAGEPWKDKPYQAWNQQEVEQILRRSPWTKEALVPAEWTLTGRQGPTVGVTIPLGGTRPPAGTKADTPITNFLIRWASSRTVRAAQLRQKILNGQLAEAEAERLLREQPTEYEITLVVLTTTIPFPDADEIQMQGNSELRLISGRRSLAPSRVVIRRAANGRVIEVAFFFPKEGGEAQPSIPASEQSAEFLWRVAGATARVKFELPQMRDHAGPDL